jgi:hypothetical protein
VRDIYICLRQALCDTNARPREAQACGFGWEIIIGLPWPTGCFAYFDSWKPRRAASLWDDIFYLLPPKHLFSLSRSFGAPMKRADSSIASVLFFCKELSRPFSE